MIWLSLLLTLLFLGAIIAAILLYRKKKCCQNNTWLCTNLEFSGKHARIKKFGAVILILIVGICVGYGCFNISTRIAFYESVHGIAEWRDSNGQKYLYVQSDEPYALGYLEGKYLSGEIGYMKLIMQGWGLTAGFTYSEIRKVALNYLDYIPEDHILELEGMAKGATAGSGNLITFNDVLIQHVFTEAVYGRINPEDLGPMGCTAIASRNTDNTVTMGQNWDFSGLFKNAMSWVHSNLTGKYETFILRAGACLSAITGKNEHNVSVISTLVEVKEVADYMMPLSSFTKLALEETCDVENAYNTINSTAKNPYAFSMIVGNETTLIATMNRPEYEYENTSDQIVYTNTFTMTEWQFSLSDPTYSVGRQNYAEELISTVSGDGIVSNDEILTILKDEPKIARGQNEVFGAATCAYFTQNNFGLGIAGDLVGIIPI